MVNMFLDVKTFRSLPREAYYLTKNGKLVDSKELEAITDDKLVNSEHKYRIHFRILGGKGGLLLTFCSI